MDCPIPYCSRLPLLLCSRAPFPNDRARSSTLQVMMQTVAFETAEWCRLDHDTRISLKKTKAAVGESTASRNYCCLKKQHREDLCSRSGLTLRGRFFLLVGRYLSDWSWHDAAIIKKACGHAVIINIVTGNVSSLTEICLLNRDRLRHSIVFYYSFSPVCGWADGWPVAA